MPPPRGLDGTRSGSCRWPSPRAGPVNTSPLGMLCFPSELIHVRPSTRRRRSVPSASIRISRASASRSTSPCWRVAQLAPGADRVGTVEEQRPLDERLVVVFAHPRLLRERRRRPQRPAPARRQARLLNRPARAGGTGDEGRVDAGERARVGGRGDPDQRVGGLAPRRARAARRSRAEARGRGGRTRSASSPGASRTAARRRGRAAPGAAPWASAIACSVSADQHLVALAHLDAPVAQQPREPVGVDHGASSSGKCSCTCSRSESRTNLSLVAGGHPVAAEQLLLPGELEPGDRPRYRQALEQVLAGALPGVLPLEPAGERLGVLAPGRRRERAAQRQHVALGVAVLTDRRGELLALTVAATHAR